MWNFTNNIGILIYKCFVLISIVLKFLLLGGVKVSCSYIHTVEDGYIHFFQCALYSYCHSEQVDKVWSTGYHVLKLWIRQAPILIYIRFF